MSRLRVAPRLRQPGNAKRKSKQRITSCCQSNMLTPTFLRDKGIEEVVLALWLSTLILPVLAGIRGWLL